MVDVGVAADLDPAPGLLPRKVRRGTADLTAGPAMTRDEARARDRGRHRDGPRPGRRGQPAACSPATWASPTPPPSAALICRVHRRRPGRRSTGRGTGIDDATHARKIDVVRRGPGPPPARTPADPIGVLAAVGGPGARRRSPGSCSAPPRCARRSPRRRDRRRGRARGAALCPDCVDTPGSRGTARPSRATRWPSSTSACARCSTWTCGSARAPARCWRCRWCQRGPRAAEVATFDSAGVDGEGPDRESATHREPDRAARPRVPRRPAPAGPPGRRRRRRAGRPAPGGRAARGRRGHRSSSAPRSPPPLEALADAGEITWQRRPLRSTATSPAPGTRSRATDDPEVNADGRRRGRARARLLRPRRRRRRRHRRRPRRSAATTTSPSAVHGGGDPRRAAGGARRRPSRPCASGTLADRRHRVVRPRRRPRRRRPRRPGPDHRPRAPALAQADVVVADRLAPQPLLDELPPDVERHRRLEAARAGAPWPGARSTRCWSSSALAGRRVVRLKGGDPFVFGRGVEEIQACVAAGVAGRGRPRHHQRDRGARRWPASRSPTAASRTSSPSSPATSPPGHAQSLVDWAALGTPARHARDAHGRREHRRHRRGARRGGPRPGDPGAGRPGGRPARRGRPPGRRSRSSPAPSPTPACARPPSS